MPSRDHPPETDNAATSSRYMVRARASGNAAVLFGFVSIALVAIIGTTIDLSRLTVARGELKQRLDAALIAGARENGRQRRVIAEDVFDAMPTGSIARTTGRRFESDPAGVSGTVSAAVPTTLASMLGIPSIRATASGRAIVPAGRCADTATRKEDRTGCSVTVTSSTRAQP